ncbi:uncharacterized protein LOC144704956 [Wolffia australiana]
MTEFLHWPKCQIRRRFRSRRWRFNVVEPSKCDASATWACVQVGGRPTVVTAVQKSPSMNRIIGQGRRSSDLSATNFYQASFNPWDGESCRESQQVEVLRQTFALTKMQGDHKMRLLIPNFGTWRWGMSHSCRRWGTWRWGRAVPADVQQQFHGDDVPGAAERAERAGGGEAGGDDEGDCAAEHGRVGVGDGASVRGDFRADIRDLMVASCSHRRNPSLEA